MKKDLVLVLCLVMVVSLLVGCGSTVGDSSNDPSPTATSSQAAAPTGEDGFKGTIKLGMIGPKTGPQAEYGIGFEIAINMAMEEINAAGGVGGYKLELVPEDDGGNPTQSADLAKKLGDRDDIMAIIGCYSSSCSMAAAPVVDAAEVVLISPASSSPDYAKMSPWCFGIVGRQSDEAPYFSTYLIGHYLKSKSVGIIWNNNDFGKTTYDNFTAQLKKDGIEMTCEASYADGETDFSASIAKIRATNPEVLMIIDTGLVPQVVNQVATSGWDVQMVTLGPGTSAQILELCGENAEGLLTTANFLFDKNNPADMAWLDEFTSKSGWVPSVHPVCARDITYMLAESIEKCGDNVTRDGIRNHLQNISFDGMTGHLEFTPDGDVIRRFNICLVKDGEWIIAKGLNYADEVAAGNP